MAEAGDVTRRDFLCRSALGAGAGAAGLVPGAAISQPPGQPARLPREVWVATFSQREVRAEDPWDMQRKILAHMEAVVPYQPDVVCLPETFATAQVRNKPPVEEIAERPLGPYSAPFAEFAKRNRCYVIVPIHTRDDKGIYNSAIFFDREGGVVGEYRKMRPTENELAKGISPGPLDPPVFRTDFGLVGAQICFDVEYPEGPRRLMEKGAEIIFFPAAFAGGQMVTTMAWQTRAHVVSSTRKDTARICDITGEEIARTGTWNPNWAIASVNLEKAFLHSWPYSRRFPEVQAKYGRKLRITNFQEEEWSVIESLDPEVRVADVMREFGLKTREEHLAAADQKHRQFWKRA